MARENLHLRQLRTLNPDGFATRVLRARPVLVALLVGGALLATMAAVLYLPQQPSDQLLPAPRPLTSGVEIRATIRSIDPARGEMTVRIVPTAIGAEYSQDGRLTQSITLIFNDVAGRAVQNYPARSFMSAADVTLALTGGRVVRYPFDTYRAQLALQLAASGSPDQLRDVSVNLLLTSSLDEVHLTAQRVPSLTSKAAIELTVTRPLASKAWVVFLMVLMWALGLGAASIAWLVIVWQDGIPIWTWGYNVGVLFALPTLRNGLAGAPPNGSLIDIAAFYWSIGLVMVTLIAMIVTWNVRIRQKHRVNAGTAGPRTMQQWALREVDSFEEP